MKKLQSLLSLFMMVGLIAGFSSCSSDDPAPVTPSGSGVSFTMADDASQDFYVKCTNTSTVKGSETWIVDGENFTGSSISFHAPIPQTYHIQLIISTADGEISKADTYTTTVPDLVFLSSPWIVALTGGYDHTKTWKVESSVKTHYSLGPDKKIDSWWNTIAPNGRPTSESYDDELTFGLIGGATVTMQNGGKSYVNNDYSSADYFTNPVLYSANNEGWIVEYNTTALKGNWKLNSTDSSLIITSETPMFLGMYNGSSQYFVKSIDENRIQVSCKGKENVAGTDGYEHWHYKWVNKAYTPPAPLVFTVNATPSDPSVSATMSVTAGAATELTVNYGDGTAEEVSTDVAKAFTHTYANNGVYTISFKAKDKEDGSFVTSYAGVKVTTAAAVTPATLTMINDFDAVTTYAFTAGGDAITLDFANPSGAGNVAKIVSPTTEWDNIYLVPGTKYFTFDGTSKIRMRIYATEVGQTFALELNDPAPSPWERGAKGLVYGSPNYVAGFANEWVDVVFDFSAALSADGVAISTDATRKAGYYNKMVLFVNPGNPSTTATYYLDDVAGNIIL